MLLILRERTNNNACTLVDTTSEATLPVLSWGLPTRDIIEGDLIQDTGVIGAKLWQRTHFLTVSVNTNRMSNNLKAFLFWQSGDVDTHFLTVSARLSVTHFLYYLLLAIPTTKPLKPTTTKRRVEKNGMLLFGGL